MQDRYAFDIGDFGKVGLLRRLAPAIGGDLGVIWYATSIHSSADDGRHTAYLDAHLPSLSARAEREYRICDAALFDAFRAALACVAPKRSIARLESLNVLPTGARTFPEVVVPGAGRPHWFGRALAAVRGASLVFCDPDNGIARSRSTLERSGSAKHLMLDEARQLYASGHSLVLYHHLSREAGGHVLQIGRWRSELASVTGCADVVAVHFRRGSARAFFMLLQEKHAHAATCALRALRSSAWSLRGHLIVRL